MAPETGHKTGGGRPWPHGTGRRGAPPRVRPRRDLSRGGTAAAAQRSISPAMNRSTMVCPSLSLCCSGGDFMK